MTKGTCFTTLPPPPINSNGYEYVDLGLPSHTLWATCNVGASNPSDYGQYFQWGDTVGYTAEQVGTGEGQKEFDLPDYKWYSNDKYDSGAKLELEDDAAHVNMGGDWHMPTDEQCEELSDNTTSAWTISDNVSGVTFTSKKDGSKSIFIPAAGSANNGKVSDIGIQGNVWASMNDADFYSIGHCLQFNSEGINAGASGANPTYYGQSVRGVIG